MPFGIPDDQIVDAETSPAQTDSVSRPPPLANVVNLQTAQSSLPALVDPSQLALVEKRARAVVVFVKLPFYAAIALNGRVPALFRLVAVGLGALEAMQLAQDNHLADQYLPQELP